jgi:hypothetical protein
MYQEFVRARCDKQDLLKKENLKKLFLRLIKNKEKYN